MSGKANLRSVEEFLQLVKDHPMLYDPKSPEYFKADKREQAWAEIAEAIIVDWADLDSSQRVKQSE